MEQYIGNNIKRMRKQRKITQSEFASYMNVSHQTVSKWENGTRVPDAYMLPMIAMFFGVSIDELFSDEELNARKYEQQVETEYKELTRNHDYARAKEVIFEAYKKAPNNYRIMCRYIESVARDADPSKRYLLEMLFDQIVKGCSDRDPADIATYAMVKYYSSIGDYHKALGVCYREPYYIYSVENLTCYAAQGDYLQVCCARSNYAMLKSVFTRCKQLCSIQTDDETLQSYLKYLKLLDAWFGEDSYAEFDAIACEACCEIAKIYYKKGSEDDFFEYIEKAVDHYIKYYSRDMQVFTDPWLKGLDYQSKNSPNMYKNLIKNHFLGDEYAKLRADSKFNDLIKKCSYLTSDL